MGARGANTFPSRNRLPYPFSLVVRPLFCFVVCWHSLPFQDKYVSGDSVNFRGSDNWPLCWGRLDLLLVRTQRVDPSACVFIFGCFTTLHIYLFALHSMCAFTFLHHILDCLDLCLLGGVSRGKRPNTQAMSDTIGTRTEGVCLIDLITYPRAELGGMRQY